MSGRRSLRRLWRSPYVFAAAVLLFASGLAAGGTTLASFSAQTQNNPSTFAGGWIGAATGPFTVTPTGYGATLGWNHATHGLDGQQLYGLDNGTTATCPSSGYTSLATMSPPLTNAYTDSSAVLESPNPASNVNGHYVCYRMVSTRSGSSWTATASFPATILGLVPTGIASSASGSPTNGSTFTVTYNQNVTVPNPTTITVCLQPSQNQIVLGDGSCAATIGTIGVPGASSSSKENDCGSSSVAASTNRIVITLGGCKTGNGNQASFSGTATYTAAGSTVTSSSGSAVQCTTSLCKPTATFA